MLLFDAGRTMWPHRRKPGALSQKLMKRSAWGATPITLRPVASFWLRHIYRSSAEVPGESQPKFSSSRPAMAPNCSPALSPR